MSGLTAFALWGLIPIYFKLLGRVPPLEIIVYRVLGAAALLLGLLIVRGERSAVWAELRSWSRLRNHVLTAALIFANWLLYIWAVNHGHILDASLGYFINPLVSVLLGVLFLKETLTGRQRASVLLATVGVLILVIGAGIFPWISLLLAGSFGSYGLFRKKATYGGAVGLCLEAIVLSPFAIGYLIANHGGSFGEIDRLTDVLLGLAGLITIVPLLLFLRAARQLPLSTVGLLQYVAPTLQFLLAVLVYGESFSMMRLVSFSFVWAALVLFTFDLVTRNATLKALARETQS